MDGQILKEKSCKIHGQYQSRNISILESLPDKRIFLYLILSLLMIIQKPNYFQTTDKIPPYFYHGTKRKLETKD